MKVIKRSGKEQSFNINKIERAIRNANESVDVSSKMSDEQIDKVINTVSKRLAGFDTLSTETIDDFVEMSLTKHNRYMVLKAYEDERSRKQNRKKFTENEEKALAVISGDSDLRGDNANKNIDDNGAISDYFAGILTKSIGKKLIPNVIWNGHNKGWWHFHDSDYSPVRPMHNCDLSDTEDMLNNSFVMGTTLIEPNEETPFRTACNLLAQINLQLSGRQYGGQTQSWAHLLPYIDYTRKLYREKLTNFCNRRNISLDNKAFEEEVESMLKDEIYEGVKTYQYQVLCHSSSNGQTPFVSNNICLREAQTKRELDDMALLIEAILKRRIKGVKDPKGHYVSPLFPKLLYWTCEGLNIDDNDPYFYLTQLAAICESARMQPDIMSEKQMRKVKKGQIIPTMGCRSLLAPIWELKEYSILDEFYWTEGNDRGEYPYGTFVEKRTFANIPDGDYSVPSTDNYTTENGYGEFADYVINFRGNTGWLVSKHNGKIIIKQPKIYGRWNNGVVTINLPHAALTAIENVKKANEDINNDDVIKEFYKVLDDRLKVCRKALQLRYEYCSKIKGKNSAILWMYGALARFGAEETVGDYMKQHPDYASISLGYVGLYETCRALIQQSNTTSEGQKLSIDILTHMNKVCEEWKAEDHINYSIYGTPEESLTYKFALANRRDFGLIPYVTDKDYVVNSYHVDPREEIDCFSKLEIEGKYLALSSGGAVSYVETTDLTKNPKAIINIIRFIHENIIYAEINRKIGVCHKCGYVGDIPLKKENGNFIFECPNCGNTDDDLMDVTARICGYLGKVSGGNTNKGRLDDIWHRVLHTDCKEEFDEIINTMDKIINE